MKKIDREKVLRFYLIKAIKETISQELIDSKLISMKEIRENNLKFSDRVLLRFLEYTLPHFTLAELILYINKVK